MIRNVTLVLLLFLGSECLAQSDSTSRLSSDSARAVVDDSSQLYGLIPQRPIKVGGGPADQRKYLDRLRDVQGKEVIYVRLHSCCFYVTNSPKALFGSGMLDIYEINYRDSENKKRKLKVYMTFYDQEQLKPIKGFTLIE